MNPQQTSLLCLLTLFILTGCSNTPKNLAIEGYDPVAYFTESKPKEGDSDYSLTWHGRIFYFASEANKNIFLSNPSQYAPAYDGYCAYGVSVGSLVDVDPLVWKIYNKHLYLNVSERIQKSWQKDIPGYIKKADYNWPELQKRLSRRVSGA